MKFEWDARKNSLNLKKHGISFEEAKEIFLNPVLTAEDKRNDYGEKRFISIGQLSDLIVLVVAHTDRNGVTRLISARKANMFEKELYYGYIKKKT